MPDQTSARFRGAKRVALALASLMLLPLAARPGLAAPGPNLLPNASFERSVVEPPPPVPPYSNPQPALPEGWAVEGAAGLFDHSQNDHFGSGRRMAAISIPLSGKRRACIGDPVPETCADDPTAATRENTVATYYSLQPAWRNAVPVSVLPGQSYTLSGYLKVALVTAGEAAVMRVRWLDANGVPINIVNGGRLISTGEVESAWTLRSSAMTAPAAARQAVVLLAHTTDAWIGQVRFDQVYFGRTNV
jgi:hypothetical protein